MKSRSLFSLPPYRKPSLSLTAAVLAVLAAQSARAATQIWDGNSVGAIDIGVDLNWSENTLPSVATPDLAQWSGLVAGPLSLLYSNIAFAGVAGNPGLSLQLTEGQVDSLNIDSGTNTNSLRMDDITIDAGAGAFSMGDGANTFNLTLGGQAGQTHLWTNHSSNPALIGSDVVLGLGGGGAHSLALGGAGNWTFNNAIGQGTGTLTLVKNNTGTLTLKGASTYTGGTVLNGGTLNINHNSAIGNTATGILTINGGVIDNTSGALVTTTTAKAQVWNGDFLFTGSNPLSFNGGGVTLGGTGTSRQVNVAAGTLTEGAFLGIGYGLTKAGAGTLAINSAAVSRITGELNVAEGKLQIAVGANAAATNDFIAGGLSGNGTIETGGGAIRWLFIQNNTNNLFSGILQNGSGAALGVNKSGTGALTLTGVNSYTDQTTLGGGTLEYGASNLPGITQTVGRLLFDRGDSTVKSSSDGSGTASLTFLTSEGRTAGATGNFVTSGGGNGISNKINLTKAAGFIDQGTFFNGRNYAVVEGLNGFVRGISYGTDANTATSGGTVTLAATAHQEFTGEITAQESATFTTLKDAGNNALTLAPGAIVTTNGLLKSGNVAGGATISGGAGIQAAAGAELVIRTDEINDALTLNTPILANGSNALTSSGAGLLTLAGANTYTGVTSVNSRVNLSGSILAGAVNIYGGGTLNVTGMINNANANSGQITVGNASGGNAILNIDGGTVKAGKTTSPSLAVGNAGNANGFVRISSGTLSTVSELHLGRNAGAAGANPYAAFTQTGGTVTSGNWVAVGLNNDRAVLNQSGGTFTVSANRLTIGAGGSNSIGVVNLSGGTFTDNGGIFVGENGTGILNVSGSASLNLGTGTMQFAGQGSSVAGTVNLLGGTINTGQVTKGTGTGTYLFNFGGGTLKATAASTAFFNALANTTAYVNSGGGTIDNGGFAITVAQPLLAATGNGINGVSSFTGGAGYIDTPVVTVLRGAGDTTGIGATAVANVSNGVVTGITITSPGTGYTSTPTFSLYGGGYSTPATVLGAAPTANLSGGLVFNGSGNTTLTGQNAGSYSGGTTVENGTLTLTGANNGIGIIRGGLTINPGATVHATTANAFGYNSGTSVTSANINGGTLTTSAVGDQGFNTTFNLTGGTLTSNGGLSDPAATSYWVLGRANAGLPDKNAVNSFASPLVSTIAGRLQLRNDNANDHVTFTVADGAAATDLLVSAAITESGSVGIIKAGAGVMTLGGTNTYTGTTVIEAGTLAVSGSISGSSRIEVMQGAILDVNGVTGGFTVAANQTLEGAGTVNGVTVLGGGAKLAPGLELGTLSFNTILDLSPAITPNASASLVFQLGAPAGSDKVILPALVIGTGFLAFNDFAFSTAAGFAPGDYLLFDSSASIAGSLDPVAANLAGSIGGLDATLQLSNGGTDLVLHVVPEPGSAMALLTGLTTLIGLKRFRTRRS